MSTPMTRAGSPALRQLDCLGSGTTAEVDDDLPRNAAPEALSEEDLEFASAAVGAAIAVALASGPFTETTQQMIGEGSTDESSSHRLHLRVSRTVKGRPDGNRGDDKACCGASASGIGHSKALWQLGDLRRA